MKQLEVIVPPGVHQQIREIVQYIARDSIDNALAWEDRLLDVLSALSDVHGHAIDEAASERIGMQLRKATFEGTYLIHYTVSETDVNVVNVRHGSRMPRIGEP